MKSIEARANFDPAKEVPSLEGKIIFITGGTAGIGAETVRTLAPHGPSHIYITGRNQKAATTVINEVASKYPSVGMTFVKADFTSLASVREAVKKTFKHDRLDILFCTAGVMTLPPELSKDGYEIQFAINHLGNATVIDCLLPTLLSTADLPNSDVRVLITTSMGHAFHPKDGISFKELDAHSTMERTILGPWIRYGQSKLANILCASELARRYPQIKAISVHPGVTKTDLVFNQSWGTRQFINVTTWLQGLEHLSVHQGAWNQVWCSTVAKKEELVNGGFYYPVGVEMLKKLDKTTNSKELASRLWEWTQTVLQRI